MFPKLQSGPSVEAGPSLTALLETSWDNEAGTCGLVSPAASQPPLPAAPVADLREASPLEDGTQGVRRDRWGVG